MGRECCLLREEFCHHLRETIALMFETSRQLRLAEAFAPNRCVRFRLESQRRRLERLRRCQRLLLKTYCPCRS